MVWQKRHVEAHHPGCLMGRTTTRSCPESSPLSIKSNVPCPLLSKPQEVSPFTSFSLSSSCFFVARCSPSVESTKIVPVSRASLCQNEMALYGDWERVFVGEDDHPDSVLHVREGDGEQVGGVPGTAAGGVHGRRRPGRTRPQALLLPANAPLPRRPHRETPQLPSPREVAPVPVSLLRALTLVYRIDMG